MPATPAHHTHSLTIEVRAPFTWRHSLQFICGFPATRGEQEIDGDHLVKAWRFDRASVVTRIGAASADAGLHVELAGPQPLTAEAIAQATDRISFFLSTQDDLSDFAAVAARDRAFAPTAARMSGYHQVKFPSPLENVIWAILAQRNPMPVAREAKLRLMRHLNKPVSGFGATLLPFPSLEQLRSLTQADLNAVIRHERKAGYLAATLERWSDLDEDFLRHGDVEQVRKNLLDLPGIGPWSATFVLIRGLGRMEILPQDKEICRAAARVYGRPVNDADVARLAEPYAPSQGYWAHYLRAAH